LIFGTQLGTPDWAIATLFLVVAEQASYSKIDQASPQEAHKGVIKKISEGLNFFDSSTSQAARSVRHLPTCAPSKL